MDLNSIFVKYSYFYPVLTVDEYFIIETEWGSLIELLTDPVNVVSGTVLPLKIEDFLGVLLPDKIPATHYKLDAGKDILDYKWGGSFVLPYDFYLSEWSATRYKIEVLGENRYAFGNRRLVYRTDEIPIYNEAYANSWRAGRPVVEVRFTPTVTSWQVDEPQNINLQAFIKTTYTAAQGECEAGDTSISIDIPATPFHQACDSTPGVDWGYYDLEEDVYHYACDTVIKNAGPVLCNAEDFGVTLVYFSGFNSYSSWVGYDTGGSGTEGKRFNGLVFEKEVPKGSGIVNTVTIQILGPLARDLPTKELINVWPLTL